MGIVFQGIPKIFRIEGKNSKMNIDYERIKKYFAQNLPTWPIVAGAAAVGIGLLMVIILSNTRGISRGITTSIGLVLTLAGAICLIVYFQMKLKDSEIDSLLPRAQEDFMNEFKKHFTETNAAKLRFEHTYGAQRREIDDKFEPVSFDTFCFDRPDILHKVGSDSKVRSSIYAMSAFALRLHGIDIGEREISLISAEKPMEDKFFYVDYTALASAELIKTEKQGYSGKTKYRHLRLTDNDGNVVAEFPVLVDATADEYVETINLRIRRHKETAANEAH